jgi:putative transposase
LGRPRPERGRWERLEPYDGKLSRTVLRGGGDGNIASLPDRANARLPLFQKDGDYEAFERVLAEARQRYDVPVLAYCVLPNHWHLVLWPRADGDLSRFVGWLTLTHTQRWHAHYHTVGAGHAYQGRFKSFPVQADEHLLTVCRYVERNALRAGLVPRAEDWRWCSLWRRQRGGAAERALLSAWPVPRPQRWAGWVNDVQSAAELEALRRCVRRGCPFGAEAWVAEAVAKLGLEATVRPRGRPKKRARKQAGKGS